jgi:hypothetical protein
MLAAMILSIAGAASAVAAPAGLTPSVDANGAHVVSLPHGATTPLARAPSHAAAGQAIYSNFSSDPNNLYDANTGWTLVSLDAGLGFEQAVAVSFTPATTTHLKSVRLAIGLVNGTTPVQAELHADEGGLPGRLLASVAIENPYNFGACCAVDSLPGQKYKVVAGRTYWIAVRASGDTYAAWNYNNVGATGNVAFDSGTGWWLSPDNMQGAFAVIGQ